MKKCVVLLFALLLSSCGFSPVYQSANKNISDSMIAPKIRSVTGNKHYIFKEFLDDEFEASSSKNQQDRFLLDVSLSSSVQDLLVQQNTDIVRKQMIVSAYFSIYDTKSKSTLASDTEKLFIQFEESASPYGSVAQQDATYVAALKDLATRVRYKSMVLILHNTGKKKS